VSRAVPKTVTHLRERACGGSGLHRLCDNSIVEKRAGTQMPVFALLFSPRGFLMGQFRPLSSVGELSHRLSRPEWEGLPVGNDPETTFGNRHRMQSSRPRSTRLTPKALNKIAQRCARNERYAGL